MMGIINKLRASNFFVFLIFILSFDIALLILHLINTFMLNFPNNFFHLEEDRSISEYFQYLKYAGILILLSLLIFKTKYLHYFSLVIFFAFVLLDDSMQIHEKFGEYFNSMINSETNVLSHAKYLGEVFGFLSIGLLVMIPLFISYINGNQIFKQFFINIFFLISILVFFAVVLDFFHPVLINDTQASFILSFLEESGELFSVSLIFYITFSHFMTLTSED